MCLTDETLISLSEVCRLLPPGRNGAKPALGTILRWILGGSRAPDGTLVRLEAIRIGGKWLTSREALARWTAKLTPRLRDNPMSPPRTVRQRRRAAEQAERELENLGI
jgi:hypothetical protein